MTKQLCHPQTFANPGRKPCRPVFHHGRRVLNIDSCEPQCRAAAAGKIEMAALSHGNYPGEFIDAGTLPGLSSIGYINAVGPQDWGIDNHCNEGVELCFLESGSMPFDTARKSYRLTAGDLTITRPWQPHRVGDPHIGPGRLHWAIIDVGVRHRNQAWQWPRWLVLSREDLGELASLWQATTRPVWRATPDIVHCFQEIGAAIRGPRHGRASRIAVHLNHLLLSTLQLLRSHPAQVTSGISASRAAVARLLRDFKQDPELLARPWHLQEMARCCGLGTTAFVKHTRALMNQSPTDYLIQCRLERAAELLREQPHATIAAIAETCGFSSGQYFATRFRQHFGQTPRRQRRQ